MGAPAPATRITTDRLTLRPPRGEDAVYVAELANDLEVARMTTGVPHPYRLADAERFVSRLWERPDDRVFLIEHGDVGPIGLAGVYQGRERWPELGFWLGRSFRGRGFATEAVAALADWMGEACRRPALLAGHFTDNEGSARVLTKAGFLYTGEVRSRFSHGRQQEVATRMMVRLA